MLSAFLVDVCFVNRTGGDVQLVFVGRTESGRLVCIKGYRGPRFFPLPEPNAWKPVRAGDTLRLTYDWDDVNLAFVLIRTKDGVFVRDLGARESCCFQPDSEIYTIEANLARAPDSLVALIQR